jgi:hypothetical protein
MISISHWGMFSRPRQLMLCKGYKLADGTLAKWDDPGAIIEIVPLERGESQPLYLIGTAA